MNEATIWSTRRRPQFRLYGSLLAAAWLNQQKMPADQQEIYGCYTIADS
jgi:hypothetical protein